MSEISSGLVAVAYIDTSNDMGDRLKWKVEFDDDQPLVRLSDAEAIISQQADLLEEQKGTITALNIALGGDDSTSTENLIDASEVDYSDEGLILLCRKLTIENVRLNDVVEFQKKAWTADHEDLTSQISELEASPMSEEALDILRSKIAKQAAALKLARDAFSAINAEAKAFRSYENARNNFSDDTDERKAYERAMVKASELTKQALAAIDEALKGE